METKLEQLTLEALMLSTSERALFAQVLLASLEEDPDLDDAWAIEVEKRIAEADDGTNPAIPLAEELAQVRATLE